jgi:MerR family mercuric resistance operon transcriptional regulator
LLTIGRLAGAAGVNVETVRYYQRIGLLQTPERPRHGVRSYGEGHLARLRFIKSAQRLGFTLGEVEALLQLDGGKCAEARAVAEHRLAEVRAKREQLVRLEAALEGLITSCESGAPGTCALIDALRQ